MNVIAQTIENEMDARGPLPRLTRTWRKVLESKEFRYIFIKKDKRNSSDISGNYRWEIRGMNSLEGLQADLRDETMEVFDTETKTTISRYELARLYLESLDERAKDVLRTEMFIRHLTT